VFVRYMGGRAHVAGWQAHYNAACFYALLPQAAPRDTGQTPFGSARLRNRACWHLAQAAEGAGGDLPCSYARDEDPDLKLLRDESPIRFMTALGRTCPDELLIHCELPVADGNWTLTASGPAMGTAEAWALQPGRDTLHRIRIQQENDWLYLVPREESGLALGSGWTVYPARWPRREIWVTAGDRRIRAGRPPASTPGNT
jgi:hypothetical protein